MSEPEFWQWRAAPCDDVWPFRSGYAFDNWDYRFACEHEGETWVLHVEVSHRVLAEAGRLPGSVLLAEALELACASALEAGLRAVAELKARADGE